MQAEDCICRICEDKTDGAHFGVDSCRACAAFFKRSVMMGKTYVCRKGGEKCIIKRNVPRMCRRCRWVKCLDCGMLPETARKSNQKRNPPKMRSSKSKELSPSDVEMSGSSCDPMPSTSQAATHALPPPSTRPLSLLQKIADNFKHFESVRLVKEYDICKSKFSWISRVDSRGLIESNIEMVAELLRVTVPALAEFVYVTFDAINVLDQQEKWMVIKCFFTVMWVFECAYYTIKNFPDGDPRSMLTQTTYYDFDNPHRFLEDSQITSLDDSEVLKLMQKSIRENRGLIEMIRKLQLTELELSAVISLLVWNPSLLTRDNDRVMHVAETERTRVFQELYALYKDHLRPDEQMARIGEIMYMLTSVQWNSSIMLEEMDLLNMLDVFKSDRFLYDILKT